MIYKKSNQQGIVKLIIVIIVALIVLSYFGINIKKVAESETGQANFGYVATLMGHVWTWLTGLWSQFVSPLLAKVPFLVKN